jgi:hypothetical protein
MSLWGDLCVQYVLWGELSVQDVLVRGLECSRCLVRGVECSRCPCEGTWLFKMSYEGELIVQDVLWGDLSVQDVLWQDLSVQVCLVRGFESSRCSMRGLECSIYLVTGLECSSMSCEGIWVFKMCCEGAWVFKMSCEGEIQVVGDHFKHLTCYFVFWNLFTFVETKFSSIFIALINKNSYKFTHVITLVQLCTGAGLYTQDNIHPFSAMWDSSALCFMHKAQHEDSRVLACHSRQQLNLRLLWIGLIFKDDSKPSFLPHNTEITHVECSVLQTCIVYPRTYIRNSNSYTWSSPERLRDGWNTIMA